MHEIIDLNYYFDEFILQVYLELTPQEFIILMLSKYLLAFLSSFFCFLLFWLIFFCFSNQIIDFLLYFSMKITILFCFSNENIEFLWFFLNENIEFLTVDYCRNRVCCEVADACKNILWVHTYQRGVSSAKWSFPILIV